VGFGPIEQEQMVVGYIRQHRQIKRAAAMGLYRLTEGQAKALLRRLMVAKKIELRGAGRAAKFIRSAGSARA
jgi:ATP-dependent DNA helicase RecG